MSKNSKPSKNFYTIGVGTSAGGIDALTKLLERFNGTSQNVCVVIAQHLSPTHKSELTAILARHCKWPVVTVTNGAVPQTHHVYVTPPNKRVIFAEGALQLLDLFPDYAHAPSIDEFLISLAESEGQCAIAVILSGAGGDGADGLQAIKANGGFTLVQAPDTAQYASMPQAAIDTGAVDLVLPAGAMFDELNNYIKNHRVVHDIQPQVDSKGSIFELLSKRSGTDFSQYKPNTITRRINKRIETLRLDTMADYLDLIRQNPLELDVLFNTILIGVTEFFRDEDVFQKLGEELKKQFEHKQKGDSIRIWCVGCATGEEPYSVAILLHEILGVSLYNFHVQIFASDIDERALDFARKGIYPAKNLKKLSPEILEKYFDLVDAGYEVKKQVKQHILFARHDITNDPPFVRLDLVVCRNLLIYFNNYLQIEVLRVFNYALLAEGLLLLGKSGSVGVANELFAKVNGMKLFRKVPSSAPAHMRFSRQRTRAELEANVAVAKGQNRNQSIVDIAKETLYYSGQHPFVIINEQAEMKEVQGSLRLYVEMSQGTTNANLLKMANQELIIEIRSLLVQVKKTNQPASSPVIRFSLFNTDHFVRLRVLPLLYPVGKVTYFIVVFEPIEPDHNYVRLVDEMAAGDFVNYRIRELEQEVTALREHIQNFTEELESNNEEMQSINEELQSANEELKSSNEELETSNEELQSTNEELHTSITELRYANATLIEKETEIKAAKQESEHNAFLYRTISENIPNGSVGVLNDQFEIEFIAGRGLDMYGLKGGDLIGINLPGMIPSVDDREKMNDVLTRTLAGESCSIDFWYYEHIYLMQTIPLTYGNSKDKRIMYLTQDITLRINSENQLRSSEERFRLLVESLPQLIWITDNEQMFESASGKWVNFTGQSTVDEHSLTSVLHPDDVGKLDAMWQKDVKAGKVYYTEVRLKNARGNYCWHSVHGIVLNSDTDKDLRWVNVFTDINDQKTFSTQLEELVNSRTVELQRSNQNLEQFAYVASHDLQEPLRKVQQFGDILRDRHSAELGEGVEYIERMQSAALRMSTLIRDLLTYARISTSQETNEAVSLQKLIDQVLETLSVVMDETKAEVVCDPLPVVQGDPMQLSQLFQNLLTNAFKFRRKDEEGNFLPPHVHIWASRVASADLPTDVVPVQLAPFYDQIDIADNGIGFAQHYGDRIFQVFQRLHGRNEFSGTGIGLAICRKVVLGHGGAITATSAPGHGTTFHIYLPIDGDGETTS